MHEGQSKDFHKTRQPMGQISQVNDIADAIVYLTEAGQVTGEVLAVRTWANGNQRKGAVWRPELGTGWDACVASLPRSAAQNGIKALMAREFTSRGVASATLASEGSTNTWIRREKFSQLGIATALAGIVRFFMNGSGSRTP